MYFRIADRRQLPDRRTIDRMTPDRRLETRRQIDREIVQLRNTQLGLMLYSELRPEDTRATALLDRVEDDLVYYAQHACTMESEVNTCE